MKIQFAFVADEANVSQEGKLNVLGVFDQVAAGEFPVVHPRMVFVFRLLAEFSDSGRATTLRVRLLDEDDGALFEAAGELQAPLVPPGGVTSANQVFHLVGIQFPRPGVYRFVVEMGDLEPYVTPFHVTLPPGEGTLN